MNQIREFINNNNIKFTKGNRNASVTTLIGYSQHMRVYKEELENELVKEIKIDPFIKEEIDRLWSYCDRNNYKSYWNKAEAKRLYKF